MTKDEWMKDGTEYCCYCGTPKVSFGCCGENHFETFAQMSSEAQDEFLQYEDEDTAELEKIMLEVWQPVQPEQALQRMTEDAEAMGLYKREWVGLTDEEVSKIIGDEIGFNACWGPEEDFAKAIEAKLKEKNT
tara:strand:- start:1141 stop:1539 length:399 start_codon:yes stop_codon:yes gene_type:complete